MNNKPPSILAPQQNEDALIIAAISVYAEHGKYELSEWYSALSIEDKRRAYYGYARMILFVTNALRLNGPVAVSNTEVTAEFMDAFYTLVINAFLRPNL